MKALTVTEPWATLIAIGAKRIETRSWPTDYRGPVAIHASKKLTGFEQSAIASRTTLDAFASAGINPHSGLCKPGFLNNDFDRLYVANCKLGRLMQSTRGCVIATGKVVACVNVLALLGGDTGDFDDPMGHVEYRVGFHPNDLMRNRFDGLPIGEGKHRPFLGAMYSDQKLHLRRLRVSEDESQFSDFSVGRWLWLIDEVVRLPVPIPAKGALGFWEWEPPAELEGAA